jgi:hypothetical protein
MKTRISLVRACRLKDKGSTRSTIMDTSSSIRVEGKAKGNVARASTGDCITSMWRECKFLL